MPEVESPGDLVGRTVLYPVVMYKTPKVFRKGIVRAAAKAPGCVVIESEGGALANRHVRDIEVLP